MRLSSHDSTVAAFPSQEGTIGQKSPREHVLNEALACVMNVHATLLDEDTADRRLAERLLRSGAADAAREVIARVILRKRTREATRARAEELESAMRRPGRALGREYDQRHLISLF